MALLPFTSETSDGTNVVELLRKDHEKVKTLFRDFESAEESKEKGHIVQQAIAELEVHAAAEEKVFYPAVRKDSTDAASNVDESLEEHHVMRVLIEELKVMSPEDERFDAKFTVMAENVRHHIKEEEAELFARARTGDLNLNDLGNSFSPPNRQSAPVTISRNEKLRPSARKRGLRRCRERGPIKYTSGRPLLQGKKARTKTLQGARAKTIHKRAAASKGKKARTKALQGARARTIHKRAAASKGKKARTKTLQGARANKIHKRAAAS